MPCPSVDELVDCVAGRISPAEREAIQNHAADCAACRIAMSELVRSPPDEAVFERYLVRRRLGSGAMGVVYAAHDSELGRTVALKLLHARPAGGDGITREEARALARVSHPNVVTVFDAGLTRGRLGIVMEYVDGVTLRRWTAGRKDWRQILDAFAEAGRGLGAAHAAGIAHGDFKPENVLVTAEGRVRVTDFGLARPVAPAADGGGALAGTPAYMAPEQLAGSAADARADQFSFCVALFEALFGQRPFSGTNLAELRESILGGRPRLGPAARRIPRSIIRALDRGLAAAPEARYPSMDALLAALSGWSRQRKRLVGLFAVLALSALGFRAFYREPVPMNRICRVASRQLGTSWQERRQAVHDVLVGARRGDAQAEAQFQRIDLQLETFFRGWVTARVGACEDADATDAQTRQRYLGRLRCFDDLRSRARAAIDLQARSASNVDPASAILGALPEPESCLVESMR